MPELHFIWDPKKAASNKRKHGIGFEEARTVFLDEHARFLPDADHSHQEQRFLLMGISIQLRVLVVCHCLVLSSDGIRIISARKANSDELRQYTEFLP